VGITAGSRKVPGRNPCDRRHTYRIIIIIIIIIICKVKDEAAVCAPLTPVQKEGNHHACNYDQSNEAIE